MALPEVGIEVAIANLVETTIVTHTGVAGTFLRGISGYGGDAAELLLKVDGTVIHVHSIEEAAENENKPFNSPFTPYALVGAETVILTVTRLETTATFNFRGVIY